MIPSGSPVAPREAVLRFLRLDQPRIVVLRTVDSPTDGIGDDPYCGVETKDVCDVLIVKVEPAGVILRLDDQRHPVVNRAAAQT